MPNLLKIGDLVKLKGDGLLPQGYWCIGPGIVVQILDCKKVAKVYWAQTGSTYEEFIQDLQHIGKD